MKLIPLPLETVALTGFTHKVIITHADVAALGSGTSAALAIFPSSGTFPAGTAVFNAALNLTTAFDASDAAVNSLLVEVGDGTDPNRIIDQTEIAADGTEILFAASLVATKPYAYLAADTLDATFTVAGGGSPTLAEVNAGELEIYLQIVNLNNLEVVE